MGKSICAFGYFDLEGARSWVIRTGLSERGYEIQLCRTNVPGFLGKYRDLKKQWSSVKDCDALYVVFPGHYLMPLAYSLARKRNIPVVLDAFLSLYDSEVHDRKRYSRFHPKAWIFWFMDWLACKLADVVLIDTEEHKDYFVKKFGVPEKKMLVLPIGCRNDIFAPEERTSDRFTVHFHGTFIPLQGIEVILGAAKLLPDVYFRLIGKGQTYKEMKQIADDSQLTNVEFTGHMEMEKIVQEMQKADICLGIFGTTEKTLRVIPTKAYEILSTGRPLITAATPASYRVLTHEVNAMLTTVGNAEALASAIRALKEDPVLRTKIAENGHRLSLEKFNPRTIVAPLSTWLENRA